LLLYFRAVGSRESDERTIRVMTGAGDLVVVSFPVAGDGTGVLTDAERKVVALLLEGYANAEIATRRRASVHTIANQVASIFRKLGVGSRHELAARLVSDRTE
jgi:DNA-binding CsgD family transcriptional regulator